jgi:hypothetical protein
MARSVIREDQVLDSDFLSEEEFTVASGVLQYQIDNKSEINHTHDERYYTEQEVDTLISGSLQDYLTSEEVITISGALQEQIDTKSTSFLGLTDTPNAYSEGALLKSTASGIVFSSYEFVRYYISQDINVQVDDYGQYIVKEGSLELDGLIEFGLGGMLIIE